MKNLTDILKHPSTTLVVGDTGEGKTVVMASAMEWFNKQGIYVYLMDKQQGYPKWVHNMSSSNIDVREQNSVLCIDDAHNYFYAGMEEDREDLKAYWYDYFLDFQEEFSNANRIRTSRISTFVHQGK